MTNSPYISVIIPIYNEEENIVTLYERLKIILNKIHLNHDLIFVNDCSKDGAKNIILHLHKKDKSIKYLDFSRNFDHQLAVTVS
jgi:dolichol-phosphate mannosyltransferase